MWSMTCSMDYYIITTVSYICYCKCAYLCTVMWCHWVIHMTALYMFPEMIFIIISLKCPSATTAAQIGHWTHNGLSNRSADPNTFLTAALSSKNFLSSHDVSSFLTWLLSSFPSGHGATSALVDWETGEVLHHVSFKLRRISSRIASSLDVFGGAWMNTPLQSFSYHVQHIFDILLWNIWYCWWTG